MSIIYQPLEIRDDNKTPTGRYRVVGLSDEDSSVCEELCACETGHESTVEARECEHVQKRLAVIFPQRETKEQRADINTVAAIVAHEVNRAYCQAQNDHSQLPWEQAPLWQRSSAIRGVQAITDNPEITSAQLHSFWCAQKRADGWVVGPVKDAEEKTHPCLVPYDQLPPNQQAKDLLFQASVRGVFKGVLNG